jgi:2-deoxy-D-gluconate 3-dehydrogenase
MSDWGPFDLGGKNAIVTGGAMGIGFGIALRMVEAGANVLIGDIDASAPEAAGKLAGHRGQASAVIADVADLATGDLLARACAEQFGPVDILVNNAGIYPIAPFSELTPEIFDRIFSTNLRGLTFTTQGVSRHMIEQGSGGVIINIASIDGFHPSFAGVSAYGSSKGGVVQLTKNMALELAPHDIRVVSIAPGGIVTEGTSKVVASGGLTEEESQALGAAMVAKIPLARMGEPDDIATVAVFLASSAAKYVTGQNVTVDGGYLLS